MIIIDILNPEEVTESHAGRLPVRLAKTFRINLKKRIEKSMARRLKSQLAEHGLLAEVWVEDSR